MFGPMGCSWPGKTFTWQNSTTEDVILEIREYGHFFARKSLGGSFPSKFEKWSKFESCHYNLYESFQRTFQRFENFYKVRKFRIEILNFKFNFPTWNFAIYQLRIGPNINWIQKKNYKVDFDINFRPNSNYATSVILRLLFKIVNK